MPTLDEYEEELLRFLAGQYTSGKYYVLRAALPHHQEDEHREVSTLIKFDRWGFIKIVSSLLTVQVFEQAVEHLDALDHPPPRDRWQEVKTWFKSKWWSIPVFVLAAIVGLLAMLKAVLEWFGIKTL